MGKNMLTAFMQIFSVVQWQTCSEATRLLCLKIFFESLSSFFFEFLLWLYFILIELIWIKSRKDKKSKDSEFSEICAQIPGLLFISCVSLSNLLCFSFLKKWGKISSGLLAIRWNASYKMSSTVSGFLRDIQ